MTTLLISDFKAKCIAVVNGVHDGGGTVVITRRGKPLAKLVPLTDAKPVARRLGALAGEATEHGDIVHFTAAEEWESLQ